MLIIVAAQKVNQPGQRYSFSFKNGFAFEIGECESPERLDGDRTSRSELTQNTGGICACIIWLHRHLFAGEVRQDGARFCDRPVETDPVTLAFYIEDVADLLERRQFLAGNTVP